MDDWVIAIPVVICIILLSLACYFQEKDKEECKANGGVVIERGYAKYQCLTKEDLDKLRGVENGNSK